MGALADLDTLFPPAQITKQYQSIAPGMYQPITWIIIFDLERKCVVKFLLQFTPLNQSKRKQENIKQEREHHSYFLEGSNYNLLTSAPLAILSFFRRYFWKKSDRHSTIPVMR